MFETLLCFLLCFINYLTQMAPLFFFSEAVAQRCSVKKVFLKIWQNSQETLAQVSSCEFCKIFKNTFSYRTPPMAASVFLSVSLLLPIRFTLRSLPPPLLYSEVLFLFLILYLGALFYKKKEKKRKKYF